ncbi:MAG TPA: heme-binding protein [Burkholderiales bacterium]|nr:heme-binding protein [Burkholderiales bacterium]
MFDPSIRAAALLLAAVSWSTAMAIEEAPYTTLEREGALELRQYQPYVVAQTLVEGEFGTAGNEGFRRLFGYISGTNAGSKSIPMTAPVEQSKPGEKIAMTAPVVQQREAQAWRIAFVLPAAYTLRNAPQPGDARVTLVQMPARPMAAVRYSGTWSRANYDENLVKLQRFIAQRKLTTVGEPVWARYNPPMMPWFLRRNEILIEVRPAQ